SCGGCVFKELIEAFHHFFELVTLAAFYMDESRKNTWRVFVRGAQEEFAPRTHGTCFLKRVKHGEGFAHKAREFTGGMQCVSADRSVRNMVSGFGRIAVAVGAHTYAERDTTQGGFPGAGGIAGAACGDAFFEVPAPAYIEVRQPLLN